MDVQVMKQAALLLKLCYNKQGLLDAGLVAEVVQAFAASQASAKAQTLRRLKTLIAQALKQQQAIVTSAAPLSADIKDGLKAFLSSQYPLVKSIDWQEQSELLGGFTIQIGDMWYDVSLAHDLQTIREQLSQ